MIVHTPQTYWCPPPNHNVHYYPIDKNVTKCEPLIEYTPPSHCMVNKSAAYYDINPHCNLQQVPYDNGYNMESSSPVNYTYIQQKMGFYPENTQQSPYPAPCQGPQPWSYAYCYGYYDNNPCPYVNIIDMEDFMNNEKRKEKSRDAARCRRSRETEIFTELAHALPVKKEEIEQLDKASVMRLAISYLKVRGMVDLFPKMKNLSIEDGNKTENKEIKPLELLESVETQKMITQALDGFVLVLSGDGDVTFVSENVTEFLGISQLDLMGQPIWEYSHQCDHDELREALNGRRASPLEVQSGKIGSDVHPLVHRDFFLRLKCTLTSRGRSVNIKSASFKVIHVSGHIATDDNQRQLVSLCRPLPHPSNIEVPMGSSTFLTKHSLDMKFSYVDEKMYSLLGYQPQDLIGKSFYECHHGEDSESLLATFKSLISKGQTETCRYRFLARCGGFCWIVTQATLVYDKHKPQSVVCVNYVISGVENKDEIYSCAQLDAQNDSVIIKEESVSRTTTPIEKPLTTPKPSVVQKKIGDRIAVVSPFSNSKPRSVTAAIFAAASAAPPQPPPPIELPSVLITPPTILLPSTQHHQQQSQRGISVTAKVFAPRPQPVTSKLFVPRTEDMNKGFLMFSEEEPGLTMLKDEPDDLTHLAPTAGDACIPLEETTPFFTDMFDDFILPDSYCTLLSDDINSLDSQSSTNKAHNNTDPFINYRDESCDTTSGGSPNILSPGLAKSPAGSSLPSLCSPDGSLPEEELTFMTMNMDDDLDLTMRAPYIPMTEADDLPLLLSDDLMWGAFPEGLSLHKEINNNSNNNNINNNNSKKEKIDSSLAALLCGEQQLNQHHQQQNQQLPPLLNTQLIQTQHLHIQQQQQIQEQESRKANLIDQGGGSCNNNNINTSNNNSNNDNTDNNSNLGNSSNNDVLGQVFNKSCTNLDPTWTMTDLLQIKSNHINNINSSNHNNSSLSIQTHLQHHHQQQQQQQQQSHQSISPSLVAIPKQQHHHHHQQQQQQKTERHHITQNHKRPSNIPTLETTCTKKRIKSCEPQSSPQLLQQLMAPSPTPILKSRIKSEKLDGRWNCNTMGGVTAQQQKQIAANLQQQSSNSVLMNLLVSGCDDDIAMDSSDFYIKNICDDISSSDASNKAKIIEATVVNPNILLSESALNRKTLNPTVGGHNPLIGGTNLLSPVGAGGGGGSGETEPDVSHKLKAIAIDRNKGLKLNEDVAGKILPVVSFIYTETIAIPTLYELMSNEFDLMPDNDLI